MARAQTQAVSWSGCRCACLSGRRGCRCRGRCGCRWPCDERRGEDGTLKITQPFSLTGKAGDEAEHPKSAWRKARKKISSGSTEDRRDRRHRWRLRHPAAGGCDHSCRRRSDRLSLDIMLSPDYHPVPDWPEPASPSSPIRYHAADTIQYGNLWSVPQKILLDVYFFPVVLLAAAQQEEYLVPMLETIAYAPGARHGSPHAR